MGLSLDIPRVIKDDWKRLDLIVNKIKMRLGRDADIKTASLTLSDLLASRLIATDAGKTLESVTDLTAWIIQSSANQVIVTYNGDGTVTLSLPQNIHLDATPEFAGIVIKDSGDNIVHYIDADEFYITTIPTIPITGNPIGLLLVLTYTI
jgi:hypothetical protein